jgi:hypothetical protein
MDRENAMEEAKITSNYSGQAGAKPPGFWAVIPATVLYDQSLPWGARLLYAMISNMANMKGYCWASNAYFARFFVTQERTIIRWLNALREADHIIVSYEYFPNSKKIKERHIRIRLSVAITKALFETPSGDKNVTTKPPDGTAQITAGTDKNVTTNPIDTDAGTDKNVMTNPTSTDANTDKIVMTNPIVLTKMSPPGGDKNVGDNDLNSYNAAAAAKKHPPDEIAETAAALKKPPPDHAFKAVFSSLDPSFVFDPVFYPRAAAFLAENALSLDRYVPWVYKQCLAKKPDSPLGMFVKLFFAPDVAERFKTSFKPPPEPVVVSCPACGARHAEKKCPQCGLDSRAPPEEVAFQKRLWELPPERRTEYERRAEQLMFSVQLQEYDPKQARSSFDALNREFGLSGETAS